jgi:integrase
VKLFQNSKGAWYVSFADQTGKHRYLSLKTTEKAVAEQIAAELVPHSLSKVRDPIQKEVARYVSDKADFRSPNWTRDNGYMLKAWAREMNSLGCSCVQEIDTQKLQDWFRGKSQSTKVATAAKYLIHIGAFLKWCREERHLILYNPAEKVRVPRHSKAVRRVFLPLRDVQNLIDHCVNEELRFALYCGIHAGFRYGEVMASRPEWFDLDKRLVHIQPSAEWQPKNGNARTVPMTEEFREFLLGYGLRSPFMIAPQKSESPIDARYRYTLRKRFLTLTSQLKVDATFHDLRRTFASLKVSAGVSIYKVAKWLGHGVSICEKHYGHLIPCDAEIEVGIERTTPAPVVEAAEERSHRQLTWEELCELVWSMPMTRAACQVGISDNGLRKWCTRCKVPLPPPKYWNLPPHRRPARPFSSTGIETERPVESSLPRGET